MSLAEFRYRLSDLSSCNIESAFCKNVSACSWPELPRAKNCRFFSVKDSLFGAGFIVFCSGVARAYCEWILGGKSFRGFRFRGSISGVRVRRGIAHRMKTGLVEYAVDFRAWLRFYKAANCMRFYN